MYVYFLNKFKAIIFRLLEQFIVRQTNIPKHLHTFVKYFLQAGKQMKTKVSTQKHNEKNNQNGET